MVHSIFGASGALPRPAERMGEFQPAGETNATSPASAANHSGGRGPTNLSTVSADLLNFCKTTGRLRAAQGNTATRQQTLIRPSTNIGIAIMIAPAAIKATTLFGLPQKTIAITHGPGPQWLLTIFPRGHIGKPARRSPDTARSGREFR